MSTSKHIDRFCIAVITLSLLLTFVFMRKAGSDTPSSAHTIGYENRLFETSRVHTIDIVMTDWDSFLETCENEEYSSCTVLIDGEKFSNVGLRAKGNTSLTNVRSMGSQRYSFKLEFDQYDSSRSYYGLDKLCLNNLIQDNTLMKDYVVYRLMDAFDVDAPLCSYVYITVNGEDWGLYLAVEGIEDSFLARNYGSDTGNLYKPDSTGIGGGKGNGQKFQMEDWNAEPEQDLPTQDHSSSSTSDTDRQNAVRMQPRSEMQPGPENGFADENRPGREDSAFSENGRDTAIHVKRGNGAMGSDDVKLKYVDDDPDSYSNIFNNAKTEISDADKERLIGSLKNLSAYEDLENTLDMEEVLRYFVVHNFVVNGDSYTGSMIHNYYLHEKDGLLGMIPWDYNLAFGTFNGGSAAASVNASIDSPVTSGDSDDRPMVGWIFSDEAYTLQYHELFSAFLHEWIENGQLNDLILETADSIRPYVEKDPTKFCTADEFETGVSALTTFIVFRGEAVQKQVSGDYSLVDASGVNLSDMGSMGGNFGDRESPGDSEEHFKPEDGEDRFSFASPGEFMGPNGAPGGDPPFGEMPEGMPQDGNEMKPADLPDWPGNETMDAQAPKDFQDAETQPDFSGQEDFPMQDPSIQPEQKGSSTQTLAWILLSFACLLAGLGIVLKFKT